MSRKLAAYIFGGALALAIAALAVEGIAIYRVAQFKAFARAYTAAVAAAARVIIFLAVLAAAFGVAGCEPSYNCCPDFKQTYSTPSPQEAQQFNMSQTGVNDAQIPLEYREDFAREHNLQVPSDSARPPK